MLALWDKNEQGAPNTRQGRIWLGLSALLWLVCCAVASAATFTASLDQDTITVGGGATLSFSFEGGTPDAVPAPPGNPNIQVTATGSSRQLEIVNGQSSSRVTYTFQLTPRAAGDYTIPALAATVNGERVTSQPVMLKVVKASAPSPQAMNSGNGIGLSQTGSPSQRGVRWRNLCRAASAVSPQPRSGRQPSPGCLVSRRWLRCRQDGRSPASPDTGREQRVYSDTGEVTLKPIKAGALTIGPVTFSLVVELPSGAAARSP